MMKRMAFVALSAAMLSVLAGCNYEQLVQQSDYDYGSRKPGDPKTVGPVAYGNVTGNEHHHQNAFFEYSSALSNKVTSLNGVASAIVMLTDKNAYAAILLDWTAVGTTSSGGTEEQNNTGSNAGVFNADTGSPYSDGRLLATPYNSFFTVNDHHNLSHELKQTIATLIRESLPAVQEVHISANMELNNYFTEFAKEAWGGRSLTPWIGKFNEVVQYHFDGGKVMPLQITMPGQNVPNEYQMRR
ncbi:hypothetical protein [Paenibacillus sp. PL2-23]|uniref:hypothetical protein n=1 Tax=Paenibacillus sp. PL2-23 TaxID=2100729 RepID=UPI0030FCF2B8